jgi:hypothetical protein
MPVIYRQGERQSAKGTEHDKQMRHGIFQHNISKCKKAIVIPLISTVTVQEVGPDSRRRTGGSKRSINPIWVIPGTGVPSSRV